MAIIDKLKHLNNEIPKGVKLIAVSKTHSVEKVKEAYDAGQRMFGENRVQELVSKHEQLPKDIEWHLIGHLQTNKVKYITPFVHLIHSVDSIKLLEEINKQGKNHNRQISVLLQIYIAQEESKFGFNEMELDDLLNSNQFKSLTHINFCGLMGMASFTDNKEQVRSEFKTLKSLFNRIKSKHFQEDQHFIEVSMGMSGDFQIGIEEGSTMVRIGSYIFS